MNKIASLLTLAALTVASSAFGSAKDDQELPLIDIIPSGGKAVTYDRSSRGTTRTFYTIVPWVDDNMACKVVTYDNGEVYLQNPISTYIVNTYIKGRVEGDKLVFDFPQRIDYDSDMDRHYVLYRTYEKETTNSSGEPAKTQAIDEECQTITFTVNADGTIVKDEPTAGITMMYWLSDQFRYAFSGYSEWEISMKPLVDKSCQLPDGLSPDLYALEYPTANQISGETEEDGHHVWLAEQGNNVYLQGVYEKTPLSWVRGEKTDNGLRFEGYQYLGVDDWYCRLAYLCAANTETIHDADLDMDYDVNTLTDYLNFRKKDGQDAYVAENTLVINGSDQRLNELKTLKEATLRKVDLENLKAAPQEPVIVENEGYNNEYGFGYLLFKLPKFNTKGELMDINRLHYEIYFDGELFTAEPADYPYLTEEVTQIPYSLSNGDLAYVSGSLHYFFYTFTGFETIGIKYTYTDYDGQQYSTAWNLAGVGEQILSPADKGAVEYFDLGGNRVAGSEKGVLVKKTTYTDGKTVYSKEIRR